jgi:ribose transport system permease protein
MRDAPALAIDGWRQRWLTFFERYSLVIVFAAVLVFFSTWSRTADTFATAQNFKNVLGNQSVIGILSLAVMIPLVCGKFDFAVGPVAGLSQALTAGLMARLGAPLAVAILVSIVVGAAVGLSTGGAVAKIGVNSLIVTIGMSAILSGIVVWYTNSQSIITGISRDLVDLGSGDWLGVPRTLYVLAVVAVLVHYLLEDTPYGRYVHSIGSNEPAARLVGLPVERLVIIAFVLSGTLAAFAGILLVARNGGASPQVGTVSDSLQALSAVFLGATAIRPGRFNVIGTLVAIFFLAFTITGLSLAGAESWVSDVCNGAALFSAVVISALIGRRRTRA